MRLPPACIGDSPAVLLISTRRLAASQACAYYNMQDSPERLLSYAGHRRRSRLIGDMSK